MATPSESRKAVHGEKTIEIKIHFFTNELAKAGEIRPKHGWTRGTVGITTNESHGIEPGGKRRHFNSLMEIPAAIERVLIENGITLHTGGGGKMDHYISD